MKVSVRKIASALLLPVDDISNLAETSRMVQRHCTGGFLYRQKISLRKKMNVRIYRKN